MLLPSEQLAAYGLPRPPYGSYDQATFTELKRLGMLMVLWTVDSQDYRRPGVQQIIDSVVGGAKPGAMMLLHDGGGDRSQTVAAIPPIVKRLRAKHYHLDAAAATRRGPAAGRSPPAEAGHRALSAGGVDARSAYRALDGFDAAGQGDRPANGYRA